MRVRFMAFYDVKNAMLMERRSTETVVQREPIVDMVKFTAFCEVANGILKHGTDFVWILAGKSDANVDKIRKKVAELGWRQKALHLVYDWKNPRSGMSRRCGAWLTAGRTRRRSSVGRGNFRLACRGIVNMWMLGRNCMLTQC